MNLSRLIEQRWVPLPEWPGCAAVVKHYEDGHVECHLIVRTIDHAPRARGGTTYLCHGARQPTIPAHADIDMVWYIIPVWADGAVHSWVERRGSLQLDFLKSKEQTAAPFSSRAEER